MKTLKTIAITLFLHFALASFAHTDSIPHYLGSNILNLFRKTEEKMRNSVRTFRVLAKYKPLECKLTAQVHSIVFGSTRTFGYFRLLSITNVRHNNIVA
jgi:hypothetical protein